MVQVIFEQHRYLLSWLLYGGSAAFYTALVFRGEFSKKEAEILSERNRRSLSAILKIHGAFLAFLLLSIWAAISIYPALPDWLTEKRGRWSTFEFVLIIAAVGMHMIERRWLYVEVETEVFDSGDSSA
jgi:apolipoprotein N-acyltransferase